MENKVDSIIVTHKDRFIRFGYDWFERFLSKYNGLMSIFWTQKVKLFYAALLANNSH